LFRTSQKPGQLSQYSDWVTGWTTGFRFVAGVGVFSLRHRVQTVSEAHAASYPTGPLPRGLKRSRC